VQETKENNAMNKECNDKNKDKMKTYLVTVLRDFLQHGHAIIAQRRLVLNGLHQTAVKVVVVCDLNQLGEVPRVPIVCVVYVRERVRVRVRVRRVCT
jgi:hypothetical protein